jgi:hypothetical protein
LYGFDQVLSPLAAYLAVTGPVVSRVSRTGSCGGGGRRGRGGSAGRPRRQQSAGGAGRRVAPRAGVPASGVLGNLARLIQLHLVVRSRHGRSGQVAGASWWTGMALWGTMTAGESWWDFTPLADWPLLVNLLTHASLALELLYPG